MLGSAVPEHNDVSDQSAA